MIFASCVRLRGHGAFDPTYGHLLTAAAAGAKNDLSMLAEFLRKGVGRGWLAASGQPADVSIHKMKRSRNALYVELTDRSRPLRKKFSDDPQNPEKIKTIWGRGYLLVSTAW